MDGVTGANSRPMLPGDLPPTHPFDRESAAALGHRCRYETHVPAVLLPLLLAVLVAVAAVLVAVAVDVVVFC